MKHSLLLLAACLVLAAGCTASPKEQVAVNPLTYTDIPDPDIIRVGEDYYMVSTTMYFCPGAPIMHSRDLVHWEIVNYIYDVIEDDDIYNLRNGRNATTAPITPCSSRTTSRRRTCTARRTS